MLCSKLEFPCHSASLGLPSQSLQKTTSLLVTSLEQNALQHFSIVPFASRTVLKLMKHLLKSHLHLLLAQIAYFVVPHSISVYRVTLEVLEPEFYCHWIFPLTFPVPQSD